MFSILKIYAKISVLQSEICKICFVIFEKNSFGAENMFVFSEKNKFLGKIRLYFYRKMDFYAKIRLYFATLFIFLRNYICIFGECAILNLFQYPNSLNINSKTSS